MKNCVEYLYIYSAATNGYMQLCKSILASPNPNPSKLFVVIFLAVLFQFVGFTELCFTAAIDAVTFSN